MGVIRKGLSHLVRLFRPAPLDPRIVVGIYTYGVTAESALFFKKSDRVTIGKYCSLAYGVKIIASGEHHYGRVANYPFRARCLGEDGESETATKGEVRIGNDVWIGAQAIVLSGVTIGDGAVIGAGAVVARDIPPYAIAVGVPAKVLRYRFSENQIQALLQIKWWDWEHPFILKRINAFEGDIDAFIAAVGQGSKTPNE
jgi:acetyltransferase-like isoleucine patch superfamily enzyme